MPTRSLHFNPRPSARGDLSRSASFAQYAISIHAPLRGATGRFGNNGIYAGEFQSTPLCEGRPGVPSTGYSTSKTISIHAPLRGATNKSAVIDWYYKNFNPRPSARGDTGNNLLCKRSHNFNPRPSARGRRSR